MGCTLYVRFNSNAVLFNKKATSYDKQFRTKTMAKFHLATMPLSKARYVNFVILDDGKKEHRYTFDGLVFREERI